MGETVRKGTTGGKLVSPHLCALERTRPSIRIQRRRSHFATVAILVIGAIGCSSFLLGATVASPEVSTHLSSTAYVHAPAEELPLSKAPRVASRQSTFPAPASIRRDQSYQKLLQSRY